VTEATHRHLHARFFFNARVHQERLPLAKAAKTGEKEMIITIMRQTKARSIDQIRDIAGGVSPDASPRKGHSS